MSADRDLKLADDEDDDGPVDPDFALIGDYLAKDLPAEEMEAVKRRLVEDGEFFEKVWPIVEIWRLPRYARQRRARARRKAQGLVPQRTQSPAAPPLAIVPRRRALSAKTTSWLAKAAAVVIGAVGVYEGFAQFSVANAAERAPVADIHDSIQVETGRGETKLITLAGGSRIIMREKSRLTYKRFPGGVHLGLAAFDGELALELNQEDRYAFIRTSSGGTLFTPGTYALRCAPGCKAMLVTAGAGQVLLRGETKDKGSVTLHAGEKGRVPKHGRPEKVTGGWLWRVLVGRGWPALVPAKAP